MRFEEHFIEQVRNSIDIVDLVGGYVHLKKRGQNHMALCPFHSEKTPSFTVSASKQLFKCFGCGIGGDVFGFVQQMEGLSFPEAVRYLAERHGVPLPQQKTGELEDRKARERARLMEIAAMAQDFFRQNLEKYSEPREYLKQREIGPKAAERFRIGYAPPGNRLLSTLSSAGVQTQLLETCGLVNLNDSGQHYDKFRNRVTFPIQDLTGRTIAFGGRALGEGRPKYLNSPETPLYQKGRHLFGLMQARDAIRQTGFAILVEGYFDCIVPAQAGIENVVASLGTALTEGQVKLLGRYTRQVIVSFDPDSAGTKAAMRSIDLFLENGFHVNVLRLPEGEDPDSFILDQGVEAYRQALKKSLPYLEFIFQHFRSQQKDAQAPSGKQALADQVLPYVARIPNRIERAEWLSRFAQRLQIDERLLASEMRRRRSPGITSARPERAQPEVKATLAERTLIAAFADSRFQPRVIELVETELFEGLATEAIFQRISSLKNQNQEISIITVRKGLEGEQQDWFERLTLETPDLLLSEELVQSSIEAISDLQLERLSREIQSEIAREEKEMVSSDHLEELLRKKEQIHRKRHR